MNPNLFALQQSNQHPYWQTKSTEPNYLLDQRAGDDHLFASLMNPKNLAMLDKSQVKLKHQEPLVSKPFTKKPIRPDREPRFQFDSSIPMRSRKIQDEVQDRKVEDEPYLQSKSDEKKQPLVSLETNKSDQSDRVPNETEMRINDEDSPDRKNPSEKNDNEVLLFLSGQLQFINPTTIPDLVMNNRFIQEAMSSSDLEKFMQIERPLSEWAIGLNLQPSEMASLDPSALNADKSINAYELLDQLGLDGQQVKSELLLLKDNLPLDGLATYMIRAVVLQGQRQEVQTNIENVSDSKSPLIQPEPKIEPLPFNNYQLDSEADRQSATPPTATLVTTDPFQTIQNEWNSQTVYRVFDADTLFQDTSNPIAQDGNRLTPELQLTEEVNLAFVSTEPEIIPANPGQDLLVNPEMFVQDPSLDLQQAKPTDLTSLVFAEVPNSDELVASSTGDSQQGASQQDLENGSRQDFLTTLQISKGDPRIRGQLESNFAENLKKPVSIERFTMDTLNRAQMLVKEGGGSIRIDLGHEELGKVELAIDVKDQNLEIRVVTNSEKAREMLAQELPRLRDALDHADLNLKSVEIGLKSESQWSQQRQNDGYSQGQNALSNENQVEAGPKVFQRHQILRQQNWNQPISHNGQILIRV